MLVSWRSLTAPICENTCLPARLNTNVVGSLSGYLYDTMMSELARTTGYVISKSDWKLSSCESSGLSASTPRNTTPLLLYLSYAFEKSGISFLHGAQYVAQKLTTTTL